MNMAVPAMRHWPIKGTDPAIPVNIRPQGSPTVQNIDEARETILRHLSFVEYAPWYTITGGKSFLVSLSVEKWEILDNALGMFFREENEDSLFIIAVNVLELILLEFETDPRWMPILAALMFISIVFYAGCECIKSLLSAILLLVTVTGNKCKASNVPIVSFDVSVYSG